jgi:hypothetical protein
MKLKTFFYEKYLLVTTNFGTLQTENITTIL